MCVKRTGVSGGLAVGPISLGFKIVATRGTAHVLKSAGIDVEVAKQAPEGRPHIVIC